MGDSKEPPPGGGMDHSQNHESINSFSNTTSAWAGGAGAAGHPRKQRSFAEIMSDQMKNRNILELIMAKIEKTDSEGKVYKHKNLTFDEIGAFLFDILKISPSDCLRFNYTTGRYDTREIMFKPGVDLSSYIGSYIFLDHEIVTRKQRSNVTKITLKNVPLNIPDEEIIHLCECYGKPVDYIVHYEKLFNDKNRGMQGGTRYIDIELFQGASMNNYYWMEGPLPGDSGSRITVLHPGQTQQCSNCLKLANMGCPGKGNGKACSALKTPRTTLAMYMEMVRVKHGYRSLKEKYYELYPPPGGAGNFGISGIVDRNDEDEEVVPINPVEEKDKQIADLKDALEGSRREIQDINALKESLVKVKYELNSVKKFSSVAKSKIEFARKVTEQRMTESLIDPSWSEDTEEDLALISLYSTLVEEDKFSLDLEKDTITPNDDFLRDVEEKLSAKMANPSELKRFQEVKNKILEKIKVKMVNRVINKQRRDSVSSLNSVGQLGLKRSSSVNAGGDHSHYRTDLVTPTSLPK